MTALLPTLTYRLCDDDVIMNGYYLGECKGLMNNSLQHYIVKAMGKVMHMGLSSVSIRTLLTVLNIEHQMILYMYDLRSIFYYEYIHHYTSLYY